METSRWSEMWEVRSMDLLFYGLVVMRFAGKRVFKHIITYKILWCFFFVNLNRDMDEYIYTFLNFLLSSRRYSSG